MKVFPVLKYGKSPHFTLIEMVSFQHVTIAIILVRDELLIWPPCFPDFTLLNFLLQSLRNMFTLIAVVLLTELWFFGGLN
jgi:hypothetical protein